MGVSEYLRWGGGALILICAIFSGREYTRYTEKRIEELCGFVAFLNHIKCEIEMYLTPMSGMIRGFKNESLEALGFIASAEKSGNLGKSFSECKERTSLGKESRDMLSECFSGFGQGYKKQELTRLERYIGSLSEILEKEREALPKNAKMVSTLLLCGALGIFILLL